MALGSEEGGKSQARDLGVGGMWAIRSLTSEEGATAKGDGEKARKLMYRTPRKHQSKRITARQILKSAFSSSRHLYRRVPSFFLRVTNFFSHRRPP